MFLTVLLPLAILSGQAWIIVIIIVEYPWELSISFLSFLIAIWVGSKQIHSNLIKGKGLFKTAFNYSLLINSTFLGTFVLVAKFHNKDIDGLLLFVILIVSVTIGALSVGLIISYFYRKSIRLNKTKQ